MASSLIHIAVASEINKKFKRNNRLILLGSIAPDLSKCVGETKEKSHFLIEPSSDIPDIDKFLSIYKDNLNDDFVLGYYIHLYTDYLWFKYFTPEIYHKDVITKLDGTKVKMVGNMLGIYIYNDYTNINSDILDTYNLDLKILYEELPPLNNIIKEIPIDKIKLLINQMGEIIENAKIHKDYVFNMDNINQFIKTSVELIAANLDELEIIKKD